MTIIAAKTIPLVVMSHFAKTGSILDPWFEHCVQSNSAKIAVVSIVDGDLRSPHPFTSETPDVLNVAYDDISMSEVSERTWKPFTGDFIMTLEHAKKIVRFIKEHDESYEQYVFLVNCHYGWCRSGAVVEFIRTICDLEWDTFRRMNSNISPSAHNLRMLWKAWYTEDHAPH